MADRPNFKARALLIGDRIDSRSWKRGEPLASYPLTVGVPGGGAAVLFRYGVVVLFDATEAEETAFLESITPLVSNRFPPPETEDVEIRIDPRATEGMWGDRIHLVNDDVERLQIVADVLSKSVILAFYEAKIAGSFDRVEPLALELQRTGRVTGKAKELVRHIGMMLLSEHLMVGRVAVGEKPELLWTRPELEGLFIRLEDEFEIKERRDALGSKLDLISHTAQTLTQLEQTRRSLRLELYIVLLIVAEIFIMLYEVLLRHP
jgi:uncharacterized Rmd1/YagE family protein